MLIVLNVLLESCHLQFHVKSVPLKNLSNENFPFEEIDNGFSYDASVIVMDELSDYALDMRISQNMLYFV